MSISRGCGNSHKMTGARFLSKNSQKPCTYYAIEYHISPLLLRFCIIQQTLSILRHFDYIYRDMRTHQKFSDHRLTNISLSLRSFKRAYWFYSYYERYQKRAIWPFCFVSFHCSKARMLPPRLLVNMVFAHVFL